MNVIAHFSIQQTLDELKLIRFTKIMTGMVTIKI